VVVHPGRQAWPQAFEEGARDLVEAPTRGLRRERDVEHDDPPPELLWLRELSRGGKGELGTGNAHADIKPYQSSASRERDLAVVDTFFT
jgi:hypothetical protein